MLTKKCLVCGNEYIKRINCSLKNWKLSKYCSKKCTAKSKLGKIAWNKGLPKTWKSGRDFTKGHIPWNKGISPSTETREKISRTLTGRPTGRTGEKSNFWKGGASTKYVKLKNSLEWKNWRRVVFERDKYTCQKCGAKNYKGLGKTIELHPHHIKDRYKFPELQFEISNGQTLCIDCHRKTDNYGCKARLTI